MKVLKRGAVPKDRVYQFQCSKCGTVAEANRSEGRPSSDERDRDLVVFDCPVCHQPVYVPISRTMHGRPA